MYKMHTHPLMERASNLSCLRYTHNLVSLQVGELVKQPRIREFRVRLPCERRKDLGLGPQQKYAFRPDEGSKKAPRGGRTRNLEIKSLTLYRLS